MAEQGGISRIAPPTPKADERQLLSDLGGPVWFRVPGHDRSRTRAVCTLLHGNEPSGFRAVNAWLRSGVTPAVDAVFFIGSVRAAILPPLWSHRSYPGSRDLNRCFHPPFHGPEGAVAQELLSLLREAKPEALLDLHNNTGHSPAYAVGTRLDAQRMELTRLFADRYMLSDLSLGTLIEATAEWLPGVVIECGRAGDLVADAVALAGLERYLSLERLGEYTRLGRMEVLEAPVKVTLRDGLSLAFGEEPVNGADLTIRRDLDAHNFEALESGVVVGWMADASAWPFAARDARGMDVSRELFVAEARVIRTRVALTPVMMTVIADIAKSDCLFYAMRGRRTWCAPPSH